MSSIFLGTTVTPKRVENKAYAKLGGGGGGEGGKEGLLWEMSKCGMENGSTIKCKEKKRFACESPDSQIPKRTRYPFFSKSLYII